MTWDGSGTHNRIHNFSADASAGIQAQAVRFDAEFDDVSTALENCQTLTGETTPTHTGVAAATSTDNYLRSDQSSNQVGIFVRDVNTGVSGTMSASAAIFPAAFSEGQRVTVKVSASGSTSAPRAIIINGLSANIIDNQGSAVPAFKMQKDGYFDLVYDASASSFRTITPRNDPVEVALITNGSFTPTFAGFSSDPSSAMVYWNKTGNMVSIQFAFGLGTSNSTTFTITNWPAAIQTTFTNYIAVFGLVDNNSEITRAGSMSLTSSGAVATFNVDSSAGLWTGSSNKGFVNLNRPPTVIYSIDQ